MHSTTATVLKIALPAMALAAVPALVRAQIPQSPSKAQLSACQSNLKQLSLGVLMYVQDYDEKLPPAGKWSTVVMPYVKNRSVFSCPTFGNWGYAMNKNLSGVSLGQIKSPTTTTLFFESKTGRANLAGLAADVVLNRHEGGSNFAYADGHVKWETKLPAFGPIAPAPVKHPRRK